MMKVIATSYRVRRRMRQNLTGVQVLERLTRSLGLTVIASKIDQEDVPGWVAIQRGSLGFTDWKSRIFDVNGDLLKG
jgi:hypothetical protein